MAFAIRDPALRGAPVPIIHLMSSFLGVASAVAFSHRRAFAHYLARPLAEVPAAVEGGRAGLRGRDMTVAVRVDRQGRVADVRVEAPAPASGRRRRSGALRAARRGSRSRGASA